MMLALLVSCLCVLTEGEEERLQEERLQGERLQEERLQEERLQGERLQEGRLQEEIQLTVPLGRWDVRCPQPCTLEERRRRYRSLGCTMLKDYRVVSTVACYGSLGGLGGQAGEAGGGGWRLEEQEVLEVRRLPDFPPEEEVERVRRSLSRPEHMDMRDFMEPTAYHRFPEIQAYLEDLARRHGQLLLIIVLLLLLQCRRLCRAAGAGEDPREQISPVCEAGSAGGGAQRARGRGHARQVCVCLPPRPWYYSLLLVLLLLLYLLLPREWITVSSALGLLGKLVKLFSGGDCAEAALTSINWSALRPPSGGQSMN